ncbi:hypothetical protein LQV63_11470 [Paenibacillus profundus]|uniref:Uncharacterized protein n=1 Tax=Paenibacillus profundus TaxID=1173085 RepID=A0ABS8YD39_9BACL|nr:hypothetical protein [Paenibacillus profundus]MCE5169931.1 hypothetical protein [Paenibacillus profundus]
MTMESDYMMNNLVEVKSKRLLTDETIMRNNRKKRGNQIEKQGQAIGLPSGIRKAEHWD